MWRKGLLKTDSIAKEERKVKGFSIVEILVVLGIVGFLLIISAINYNDYNRRQLAKAVAENIASDISYTVQLAKNVGIEGSIAFPENPDGWQIASPGGVLKKSEAIPPSVHVGIATNQTGSPAQGSAADIFPSGRWLSFGPNGDTINGQSAIVVVATEGAWYVITVNGKMGIISGPTQRREEITLTDQQIDVQMRQLQPATRWTTQAELTTHISRIKLRWRLLQVIKKD